MADVGGVVELAWTVLLGSHGGHRTINKRIPLRPGFSAANDRSNHTRV